MSKRAVLVIAGSDSSGGAGIQADLKTLRSLNTYAATVITSVTSQNSWGVISRFDLPIWSIVSQFKAVTADLTFQAVKIGMLANAQTVKTVADLLIKSGLKNIVLDPLIKAHTGAELLTKSGSQELLKWLWPLADVVTPNSVEAEQLLSLKVNNLRQQKEAAKKACLWGAKAAVVKGGHLQNKIIKDVLFTGEFYVFKAANIGYKAHGAGCCFSSAIAAFLAQGFSIAEAVKKAHDFTQQAIKNATAVGKGLLIVNP